MKRVSSLYNDAHVNYSCALFLAIFIGETALYLFLNGSHGKHTILFFLYLLLLKTLGYHKYFHGW